MGDVPLGLVRVQPARLRKIKKQISSLDREIQGWQQEILRVTCTLDICKLSGAPTQTIERWNKALAKAEGRRKALDAKRKALRMEAKGIT